MGQKVGLYSKYPQRGDVTLMALVATIVKLLVMPFSCLESARNIQ